MIKLAKSASVVFSAILLSISAACTASGNPADILKALFEAEVGDVTDKELNKIQNGIVKELLELREMIG